MPSTIAQNGFRARRRGMSRPGRSSRRLRRPAFDVERDTLDAGVVQSGHQLGADAVIAGHAAGGTNEPFLLTRVPSISSTATSATWAKPCAAPFDDAEGQRATTAGAALAIVVHAPRRRRSKSTRDLRELREIMPASEARKAMPRRGSSSSGRSKARAATFAKASCLLSCRRLVAAGAFDPVRAASSALQAEPFARPVQTRDCSSSLASPGPVRRCVVLASGQPVSIFICDAWRSFSGSIRPRPGPIQACHPGRARFVEVRRAAHAAARSSPASIASSSHSA